MEEPSAISYPNITCAYTAFRPQHEVFPEGTYMSRMLPIDTPLILETGISSSVSSAGSGMIIEVVLKHTWYRVKFISDAFDFNVNWK